MKAGIRERGARMRLFWLSLGWLVGLALGKALGLPAWAWVPPVAGGSAASFLLAGQLRWLGAAWLVVGLGALRFALAQPTLDASHLSTHNDGGELAVLTGVVVDFPDVRDSYIGLRVRAERLRRLAGPLSLPVEGGAVVRARRSQA